MQEILDIGANEGIKQMAQKIIQLEDYEYLGQGLGRIVATSRKFPEDTVVKIAKPRKIRYNRTEYNNYIVAEDDLQQYLTPTRGIFGDDKWLFAVKCEEGNRKIVDKINTALQEKDVYYNEVEIASQNVGTYNGYPCIIDYDKLI